MGLNAASLEAWSALRLRLACGGDSGAGLRVLHVPQLLRSEAGRPARVVHELQIGLVMVRVVHH